MMCLNQASAVAAVRASHARACHARASFLARACDFRAVAAACGRFDRIVAWFSQNVTQRWRSNNPCAAAAARESH
eukprot:2922578-Lingulodinium_polyedra.AAC.1